MATTKPVTAVAKRQDPKELLAMVSKKIETMKAENKIHFPENFSAQNALANAWLIVQETVDRDKRPVLEVCTGASIANALLYTVENGLNPAKKQVYYIAYGKKLIAQASYFGQIAAVKRIKGVIDVFAQVVYEGDVFEYSIERAKKKITKHTQKIGSVQGNKITAAYATIVYEVDGNEQEYSEILTFDEIKQAWGQSPMRPIDDKGNVKPGTTHSKFPQEMAKKTDIYRTCKMFANTSDDSDLMIKSFQKIFGSEEGIGVEDEIEENANQEYIDISDFEEIPEKEQPEEPEKTDWDAVAEKVGKPF